MRRAYCLLLSLLLGLPLLSARSHYATIHNQFASLIRPTTRCPHNYASCSIEDNLLVIDNAGFQPLIITDSSLVSGDSYQYLVRASALHNKAGRSYAITGSDGRRHRVAETSWGIVFAHSDSTHYLRVSVRCLNSNLYDDLTDRRQMFVEVWRHQCDSVMRLSSVAVSDGVDLDDGLNTLMVNVQNHEAVISVGKKKLQTVSTIPLSDDDMSTVKAGLYVSAGAKIAVERTVLSADGMPLQRIATTWTREALDQHFATSDDPIEGYWQYQDRDMEDTWLRLGGRYTVAIVASNGGYDIIYLDGAQVNATQWQPGLLKGHISKTIFDGHYDLRWIDATFCPISLDAYAALDNGVLMTLSFPVYKSQLRLSKVLHP